MGTDPSSEFADSGQVVVRDRLELIEQVAQLTARPDEVAVGRRRHAKAWRNQKARMGQLTQIGAFASGLRQTRSVEFFEEERIRWHDDASDTAGPFAVGPSWSVVGGLCNDKSPLTRTC